MQISKKEAIIFLKELEEFLKYDQFVGVSINNEDIFVDPFEEYPHSTIRKIDNFVEFFNRRNKEWGYKN